MASRHTLLTGAAIIAALALVTPLPAQDTAGIPSERGVYYRADSGWVGLTGTVLVPMLEGGAADFFAVGSKQAIAEVPGLHSSVQTKNARPTLYVRGFPINAGIYLVREVQKQDYREIHMPVSRNFKEFAHFRSKDLREIEMRAVGNGVIALTPLTDLTPGEYAVVSLIAPNERFIRIGYDFGIAGGTRK